MTTIVEKLQSDIDKAIQLGKSEQDAHNVIATQLQQKAVQALATKTCLQFNSTLKRIEKKLPSLIRGAVRDDRDWFSIDELQPWWRAVFDFEIPRQTLRAACESAGLIVQVDWGSTWTPAYWKVYWEKPSPGKTG